MQTTKIIRDIPLGVLMLVVSQFFIYGALYLSKFPNVFEFLGIMFCVWATGFLTDLGIRVIKGIEVAESE
jgi:hypothetical protein